MRTVGELENAEKTLLGDIICAAAQVAYLGAFNGEYRSELVTDWSNFLDELGLVHSAQLSVFYTLGNPITMRSWFINGLPSDNLSMENGIILTKVLPVGPQALAVREASADWGFVLLVDGRTSSGACYDAEELAVIDG